MLSLFEVAARTRLSLLAPDVYEKIPIFFQNFEQYSEKMEYTEEWVGLAREVTKKFGHSKTICELTAAAKKTIISRRANSPYMRKILIDHPRFFKYGRALPDQINRVFDTNYFLVEEFYNNLRNTPGFETKCNFELLNLAFPKTLKRAQLQLKEILECFENLEDLD